MARTHAARWRCDHRRGSAPRRRFRGSQGVAAYNVAGGARVWFTELPIRQSDDIGMTVTDGVIIVSGGRLGNRGPHTIVVDEKTGRRLWSSAQDLMSPRRGSDTILVSNGPTE